MDVGLARFRINVEANVHRKVRTLEPEITTAVAAAAAVGLSRL